MSDDQGFKAPPIKGYQDVPGWKTELVNEAKELEERTLRFIDRLRAHPETDKRLAALAFTATQEAFMWANRAVFQPQRIKLPEDDNQS